MIICIFLIAMNFLADNHTKYLVKYSSMSLTPSPEGAQKGLQVAIFTDLNEASSCNLILYHYTSSQQHNQSDRALIPLNNAVFALRPHLHVPVKPSQCYPARNALIRSTGNMPIKKSSELYSSLQICGLHDA